MAEKNLSHITPTQQQYIRALAERCGLNLADCCQCGKCSAGCPLAASMDMTPRQVLRCLQLGLWQEALASTAPSLCLSCYTCSSRCPRQVPLPQVLAELRREAARAGLYPLHNTALFDQAFLRPLRWFGRSHELTLTIFYNIGSGRLFQHFRYLPAMIKGRKLKIWPARVKDRAARKQLRQDCAKGAGQ